MQPSKLQVAKSIKKSITRMVNMMDYIERGMKMVNWHLKKITRMVWSYNYSKPQSVLP